MRRNRYVQTHRVGSSGQILGFDDPRVAAALRKSCGVGIRCRRSRYQCPFGIRTGGGVKAPTSEVRRGIADSEFPFTRLAWLEIGRARNIGNRWHIRAADDTGATARFGARLVIYGLAHIAFLVAVPR